MTNLFDEKDSHPETQTANSQFESIFATEVDRSPQLFERDESHHEDSVPAFISWDNETSGTVDESQDDEQDAYADVAADPSVVLFSIAPQSVIIVTEQVITAPDQPEGEQLAPHNEVTANRASIALKCRRTRAQGEEKKTRGAKKTDFTEYKKKQEQKVKDLDAKIVKLKD